jgi:hypothetical protein
MDWIKLPRLRDPSGEELDGRGEYTIINPTQLYRGRSYSDLVTDWLNWFLSADADKRNLGPIVFLRSKGLPNEKTGANISDNPYLSGERGESPDPTSSEIPTATDYTKPYVNDPNIRIGGDKLQISEDQAVFIPIIVAFSLKTSPYTDWGNMQDLTGLTIDYGDNPPDISQLTINGRDIDIPITEEIMDREKRSSQLMKAPKARIASLEDTRRKEAGIIDKINDSEKEISDAKGKPARSDRRLLENISSMATELDQQRLKKIKLARELGLMESFRITTSVFTAIVPETQYGRSTKDFIEESPVAPGVYPAMVDGYFILCKFSEGSYWVHSWASGPREARGPYFSELLYQIEVHQRRMPNMRVTSRRPARNERILRQTLEIKVKDKTNEVSEVNELNSSERRRLNMLLQKSIIA